MNEILGFIVENIISSEYGKLSFFERPVLFLALLAGVFFFKIDEPLKESRKKQWCLIFIGLGLLDIAIFGF